MATAAFHSVIPDLIPFRAPAPIENLLGRALGISEMERIYENVRSIDDDRSIANRVLDSLAISYTASSLDLARIPKSGPVILTLNHPFGILDGLILASMLPSVRPDFRFLANRILTTIPEIQDLIIPIDVTNHATYTNSKALRRSIEFLESGGLLILFPAGEVSHFQWKHRAITDPAWNSSVSRMVRIASRRRCPVTVVPAHIDGVNSGLFQIAGLAHPGFRTALLGRELLNKRGRRVEIRVGAPIPAERLLAIPTEREQTDYLRWRSYILSSRERFKPRTNLPLPRRSKHGDLREPIDAPLPRTVLAAEIASLPDTALLNRSGDLEVYLADAGQVPSVLQEIGRLREVTFRAVGEGTGQAFDLDRFDQQYLHLFVWNSKEHEVVGAYRLAGTDAVTDLYTATLFKYGSEFRNRITPALELGRSFVRQEYQRKFAPLLLLWKGIGSFVARNPRYKILFGPVSISNQYGAVSRELMVSFLEKFAMLEEWRDLVTHRVSLRRRHLTGTRRPAFPQAGFDVDDLSTVVSDLEHSPEGIPVLLRQYLRLGGKLIAFNVDPDFSDALDGLIMVDLTKTEPKLLERYLGKHEAATFLDFQKGHYVTQ